MDGTIAAPDKGHSYMPTSLEPYDEYICKHVRQALSGPTRHVLLGYLRKLGERQRKEWQSQGPN